MKSKTYKVNIAQAGVLDYGQRGLLFRDRETLIKDCKSLKGKAFTMMHPKKDEDTAILKIGTVKSIEITDSGFSGTVTVDDSLAQKLIDSKTAIEVSPCYSATIEEKERTIDGKTVRGQQTKIWGFRHLALVEAGRGGEACAIVADTANEEVYQGLFYDSFVATFEPIAPTIIADVITDSTEAKPTEAKTVETTTPTSENSVDSFLAVRNFLCTILDGVTDIERNAKNLDEFAKSYITRNVDADIIMDGLDTAQMLTAFSIDKHYKKQAQTKEQENVTDSKPATPPAAKPPVLTEPGKSKPVNNFPKLL
jgi:hypothetical protein